MGNNSLRTGHGHFNYREQKINRHEYKFGMDKILILGNFKDNTYPFFLICPRDDLFSENYLSQLQIPEKYDSQKCRTFFY